MTKHVVSLAMGVAIGYFGSGATWFRTSTSDDADSVTSALQDIRRAIENKSCGAGAFRRGGFERSRGGQDDDPPSFSLQTL